MVISLFKFQITCCLNWGNSSSRAIYGPFQNPSDTLMDTSRNMHRDLAVFSYTHEKMTLKWIVSPDSIGMWSLCQSILCLQMSPTAITKVSPPLVAFLSRSFQSWSQPINMTAFGTSWTTLYRPSTSCINSSSTPAWVSKLQTLPIRTHT